jgi:glycosyltransferase involved in cell wall biosynthesis
MIDGKTGFMVDPKDHVAFSEKVVTLLKDPRLAQQMGRAARERVLKKFSTEVVVEKNLKFYEGVVSGQRMEHG